MTDYVLVVAYSPRTIADEVRKFMGKGWCCQGGIAISSDRDSIYVYMQAMVRTMAKSEEPE